MSISFSGIKSIEMIVNYRNYDVYIKAL